jgi:hypothetical protein
MRQIFRKWAILSALAISAPAYADSYLLHLEGEKGDRRAYFVGMLVTDRTPPSIEPPRIATKELVVTIVYENPDMPELVHFNLQFECQNGYYYAFHGKKAPSSPQWNPVKTRVAAGSVILRRTDLKTEPVPASEWEKSEELAMLKANQLACNYQDIDKVVRSSMVDGRFARQKFEEKFPALGLDTLTGGLLVTDLSLWGDYIEFTWQTLWPDAKHPDPTGKWSRESTPEEMAEFKRQLASSRQQLDELSEETKAVYEPAVLEMQHKFAFDAEAAKLRGGRKLRDFEWKMLQMWQGKTEDVVIASMGRPSFDDTGGLHLLSYNQVFDNRVTVGSSTGEVWEEGLYTNCEVQFVTMADGGGTYRVADIVLSIDSSNIMATNSNEACGYLEVVPQD